jgi:hypothetical protein
VFIRGFNLFAIFYKPFYGRIIMATEAQIKANRKNALKSTGPRTEEGKEAVSQNATKHGLCSCKNVIRSESQEEYNLFHDEMISDLSPVGAMEEVLAERIVSLSWRLKRAEVYQNSAMEVLIDERMNEKWEDTRRAQEQAKEGDMSLIIGLAIRKDFANSRILDLLLMYERRIENSLYKATAELRKIQKLRKREEHRIQDTENSIGNKDNAEVVKGSELKDFGASHPDPDKTIQDEAATRTRGIMDETKEISDDGDLVKHPASSKDYLSQRNPLEPTDAAKQSQFCLDQKPQIQDQRQEIEKQTQFTCLQREI